MITIHKVLGFEEGMSRVPYYCSEMYPTIGKGTRIGPKNAPLEHYQFTVTETIADHFLNEELLLNNERVDSLIDPMVLAGLRVDSPDRIAELHSMAYQVGVAGLKRFKNMIHAFNAEHWRSASEECLDSKAYKQCPDRFARNANCLLTGEYDFNVTKEWAKDFLG